MLGVQMEVEQWVVGWLGLFGVHLIVIGSGNSLSIFLYHNTQDSFSESEWGKVSVRVKEEQERPKQQQQRRRREREKSSKGNRNESRCVRKKSATLYRRNAIRASQCVLVCLCGSLWQRQECHCTVRSVRHNSWP